MWCKMASQLTAEQQQMTTPCELFNLCRECISSRIPPTLSSVPWNIMTTGVILITLIMTFQEANMEGELNIDDVTLLGAFHDTLKGLVPRPLKHPPWFYIVWIVFAMTLGFIWNLRIVHFLFFMFYNCMVALCSLRYYSAIGS